MSSGSAGVAWAIAATLLVRSVASAAVNPGESDPFAWEYQWSPWRWLSVLVLVAIAWLLSFHALFPSRLDPESQRTPPWPRAAFGDSLALFILASCGAFLIIFGVVSDDMFIRKLGLPGGGSMSGFLNRNYLWVLVVAVGLGLSTLVRFSFRHRES